MFGGVIVRQSGLSPPVSWDPRLLHPSTAIADAAALKYEEGNQLNTSESIHTCSSLVSKSRAVDWANGENWKGGCFPLKNISFHTPKYSKKSIFVCLLCWPTVFALRAPTSFCDIYRVIVRSNILNKIKNPNNLLWPGKANETASCERTKEMKVTRLEESKEEKGTKV